MFDTLTKDIKEEHGNAAKTRLVILGGSACHTSVTVIDCLVSCARLMVLNRGLQDREKKKDNS